MIEVLILGLVIFVPALAGLLLLFTFFQMSRLPVNNPSEFLKRGGEPNTRKRVVLVGDSLTHGRIGANYVEMLMQWDKTSEFEFINAGINGDLVWNVSQRIDEIVECNPDVITILIGTNDASASLCPGSQQRYAKRKNLPTLPTHNWFRTIFTDLLTELIRRTQSCIAVFSIPTISEDLDSHEFQQSQRYSETIKEIVTAKNIEYLPLNEMMVENGHAAPLKTEYSSRKAELDMVSAAMRYYLFHQDWDSISEKRGLEYHIDYLHLNTQGATMIANLILQFLQSGDRIEGGS